MTQFCLEIAPITRVMAIKAKSSANYGPPCTVVCDCLPRKSLNLTGTVSSKKKVSVKSLQLTTVAKTGRTDNILESTDS